jgi:hypothetical protein
LIDDAIVIIDNAAQFIVFSATYYVISADCRRSLYSHSMVNGFERAL